MRYTLTVGLGSGFLGAADDVVGVERLMTFVATKYPICSIVTVWGPGGRPLTSWDTYGRCGHRQVEGALAELRNLEEGAAHTEKEVTK